jgi:hypothetical protein
VIDAKPVEEIYAAGNYFQWLDGMVDPWQIPLGGGIFRQYPNRVKEPWPAPSVTMQSAQDAYELVLQQAGCFPRDSVSRRTIEEVRSGTGSWGRHEPAGGLMEGLESGKPPADSDNDGMPDVWERRHKLNPNDSSDANRIVPNAVHKGYTFIEYYINELADRLIAAQTLAAGSPAR